MYEQIIFIQKVNDLLRQIIVKLLKQIFDYISWVTNKIIDSPML